MALVEHTPAEYWDRIPEMPDGHRFIRIRKEDVPAYLKVGLLYHSFKDTTSAWETEDEHFEVPIDCFKSTDAIRNGEELLIVFKSLRFWIVSDLPVGLMTYAFRPEERDTFMTTSAYFEEDIHTIKSLRRVVAAQEHERMAVAAREGMLAVMQYLHYVHPKLPRSESVCVQAVEGGHLECLRFAHENGWFCSKAVTEAAVQFGRPACLKYAFQHQCPFDAQTLCQQAYQAGHVACLRYAHEHGCDLLLNTPCMAAGSGGLECLQYAHEHGVAFSPLTSVGAAMVGNLACLYYLREKGYVWNRLTCQIAAKYGQLECLKFAHENGCSLTATTCEIAAEHGHLSCLQYAHQHGGTWTDAAVIQAAKGNHADSLQYLLTHSSAGRTVLVTEHCARHGNLDMLCLARAHGCPWNTSTCIAAAAKGHLAVLQYLHENQCAWNEDMCTAAARNGHLSCLQYAHQHGCPWSDETYSAAVENLGTSKHCAEYLHEHDCPCGSLYIDFVTM